MSIFLSCQKVNYLWSCNLYTILIFINIINKCFRSFIVYTTNFLWYERQTKRRVRVRCRMFEYKFSSYSGITYGTLMQSRFKFIIHPIIISYTIQRYKNFNLKEVTWMLKCQKKFFVLQQEISSEETSSQRRIYTS